jgi:hypothetical protein
MTLSEIGAELDQQGNSELYSGVGISYVRRSAPKLSDAEIRGRQRQLAALLIRQQEFSHGTSAHKDINPALSRYSQPSDPLLTTGLTTHGPLQSDELAKESDAAMPAKAGIQYTVSSQLNNGRLGLLGPRLRGDDKRKTAQRKRCVIAGLDPAIHRCRKNGYAGRARV